MMHIANTNIKNYIYGGGLYGKLLLKYFNNIGLTIEGFLQTKVEGNVEIEGVPLYSFESILSVKGKKNIFIATLSEKSARDIKRNISAHNQMREFTVYNYRDFIVDNMLTLKDYTPTGWRYCIVCENKVEEFYPYGIDIDLYKNHHIIGGGYRAGVDCPCCGVGDRERWFYYVLKTKTNIFSGGRVLHFAPENIVDKRIREIDLIDYYSADIVPGKAQHITDITDMQYKDETFDYVICNHVLEHIPDEEKAIREIKRVLKSDGKWIFSVPICTDMKTLEDKQIKTPEDRLKFYGQEDHVRLYGNDFLEIFGRYGWKLQTFSPNEEFSREEIDKYGFIEDDIIIIGEKVI